jgi:hypothetical protein
MQTAVEKTSRLQTAVDITDTAESGIYNRQTADCS